MLCGFSSLWWPFGWNWSYLGFLGIIWRTCGSKCGGEGGGIFPMLCVECCLVFFFFCFFFSKVRVGAKEGGSHYWEMAVAITCGYGGYLLPLLQHILVWYVLTLKWLGHFLAATKQLYEWFSPSVRPSVCPSVHPSHLFDYVPINVSSWNFQELLPKTKVTSMQKMEVRGQRSRSRPNLTVSGL